MSPHWKALLFSGLASAALVTREAGPNYDRLNDCPGYAASNIRPSETGLTADLRLAGPACNAYGDDLDDLVLSVTYETETRIHVKIQDQANQVYQIPESAFPRPSGSGPAAESAIKFVYTENPFSFSIVRADTNELLFDTSAAPLVFESQYLRLRASLPSDPYLYGLGEHTDNFRLNATNYTRTLWNRDSYGVPPGTNLYGSHPFYVEQRETGTHGVFLLNSNGMDVFINNTEEAGQYLEYNILGGVLDFYFLAGPGPIDVARQYAEVVGLPAMQPYWSLGFHQCRYGYQDAFEVAEVVYNYSRAGIPLETMWTDIDYMDARAVFTLDPERFPLEKVREIVDHLHENNQQYIVMVDPAIAWDPESPIVQRGLADDIFLKKENGSVHIEVVWPGVTVFPDWFAENITAYWNGEFELFFDKDTGVDIDGLWIDMNEPASFCEGLCEDPYGDAVGMPPTPPPVRDPPRPLPGFSCSFQPRGTPGCDSREDGDSTGIEQGQVGSSLPVSPARMQRRQESQEPQSDWMGLPGRDLLYPKYAIHNHAAGEDLSWNADKGGISFRTVNTDIRHQNGLAMYDTHNLYGKMMGAASFPGDGRKVGHWLGDNVSNWEQYRFAIHTTLSFSALYQFPMAGSDVCGFAQDTNEQLCARWASLGAFFTFYRNHNDINWRDQEFYRWDSVAESARRAIDIRYRLLDYIYTALYRASLDGTPVLNPMFYLYPHDQATWALQHQFFYGDGVLVAPVLEENATSVDAYLPDDMFYDWYTHRPVRGRGALHTFRDQDVTDIPLLIRSGVILPLRAESAYTTAEVRRRDFELIVPLSADGTARGELYLDDGVSVEQPGGGITLVEFGFANGTLTIDGQFGYETDVRIARIKVLGTLCVTAAGNDGRGSRTVDVDISLNEASSIRL
ncbi:alpha-glucosidase [Sodiomyces alkalinus F11]|uniref:Probable alpha/beta-glucosidase agdC n=1 Tax=Sodiomyces alkalinus (strain CBS 110278 / VKM F-3762 / F11) TaxID=1314773 RepID=A0A3N2Q5L3_SODAK|nr:alpha-glucosidase [Sodiomyces alkalinus F11]ROT41948.1 alpha-glucosidase [Sodiomyces alkalinus F11]